MLLECILGCEGDYLKNWMRIELERAKCEGKKGKNLLRRRSSNR